MYYLLTKSYSNICSRYFVIPTPNLKYNIMCRISDGLLYIASIGSLALSYLALGRMQANSPNASNVSVVCTWSGLLGTEWVSACLNWWCSVILVIASGSGL